MKSEHRHELKTNELADWFGHLPEWSRENFRMILYVSVVVVACLAIYLWNVYQRKVVAVNKEIRFTNVISRLPQNKMQILQAQSEGYDTSYNLLQTADTLETTAANTKNKAMAALAWIKRGEVLRMELHYRLGDVSREEFTAQVELARSAYNKAIEQSPSNVSLLAAARFGLGLCEEEFGEYQKARQIYEELTTDPQFSCTVAAVQAEGRLATMADYQQEVVFKETPKPAVEEPVLPQIQLAPGGVNLPVE